MAPALMRAGDGPVRLVIDPVEFALPVPLVGQLPLYYEQVRFMVGLQFGS